MAEIKHRMFCWSALCLVFVDCAISLQWRSSPATEAVARSLSVCDLFVCVRFGTIKAAPGLQPARLFETENRVCPRLASREQTDSKEELAKEQWWRVILHNDEIHTFDYVTQSITKVSKHAVVC